MVAISRCLALLLLFATVATETHAQYVEDFLPKCPLATTRDSKVWSPDCQAYFINHKTNYRLGKPWTTEAFTASLDAGETWNKRERQTFLVLTDPTDQVRGRILSECPTCWNVDVTALRWWDAETMLLAARVTRTAGEIYQLQYTVVAKSGNIVRAPESWLPSGKD